MPYMHITVNIIWIGRVVGTTNQEVSYLIPGGMLWFMGELRSVRKIA